MNQGKPGTLMHHVSGSLDKGIWRGPRPADLADLKFHGIEQIINLQSGFYELVSDTLRERQFPCEWGIDYYDLGSSNTMPPDDFTVDKCLQLLTNGKSTYVHCYSGVDRTGFIIALYRINHCGYAFHEAYAEWVRMGRHWWFFWWKNALLNQAKRVWKDRNKRVWKERNK